MGRKSKNPGLPPGSLIYFDEKKVDQVEVTVFDFNEKSLSEEKLSSLDSLAPLKNSATCSWINIIGLHDVEFIEKLGSIFDIHSLVLEDVINAHHRPKIEVYDDYLFIILKMLSFDSSSGRVKKEQVSLILGQNFLLSFQEESGDVFDPVRERIRHGRGRIRKSGMDYVAYSLLDSVVDHYFLVLEGLEEKIEHLDEKVSYDPDQSVLKKLYSTKRDLISLRKSIWPLREVVGSLERGEPAQIKKATRVYLRDLYDHTIQVIDTLEGMRDTVSSQLDLYLSLTSNRMNEIMKVLTIMSTIFIPLSFIAGVYGMNFKYMPELELGWGYAGVWALMLSIAFVLLGYFRHKKWL